GRCTRSIAMRFGIMFLSIAAVGCGSEREQPYETRPTERTVVASNAAAPSATECHLADSTELYFSSKTVKDRVVVTIEGSNCTTAVVSISIRNGNRAQLYNYATTLDTLSAKKDSLTVQDARRISTRLLDVRPFTLADHPNWNAQSISDNQYATV